MKLSNFKKLNLIFLCLGLVACELKEDGSLAEVESSYASVEKNLRLSLLPDAMDYSSIALSLELEALELVLEVGGKQVIQKVFSDSNLMVSKKEFAVNETLADLNLPTGSKVLGLQLLLKSSGHKAFLNRDESCSISTPTRYRRLIKIPLAESIIVEDTYSYSVSMQIKRQDSLEQVNGECRLRPKVTLPVVSKVAKRFLMSSGGMVIAVERILADGEDQNISDLEADGFLDILER